MDMTDITPAMIDDLRMTAKNYGCSVGNLRDPAKLQAMIDKALRERDEPAKVDPRAARQALRTERRKDLMKLVRVRITPMAPFEKQLAGTIMDVGNTIVGNVKRYIPFNVDWHIEQIILNALQDKKYRAKREYTDPQTRRKVYENQFHKSFGIEVLPALTEEELEDHRKGMQARHYGN